MSNENDTHAPADPNRPGMICIVCGRQIDPTIGYRVDALGRRRHPECEQRSSEVKCARCERVSEEMPRWLGQRPVCSDHEQRSNEAPLAIPDQTGRAAKFLDECEDPRLCREIAQKQLRDEFTNAFLEGMKSGLQEGASQRLEMAQEIYEQRTDKALPTLPSEDEGAAAVASLGIDIPAWAAEIRAKVAVATNAWRIEPSRPADRWHAIGPWRGTREEAEADAQHASMLGALPERDLDYVQSAADRAIDLRNEGYEIPAPVALSSGEVCTVIQRELDRATDATRDGLLVALSTVTSLTMRRGAFRALRVDAKSATFGDAPCTCDLVANTLMIGCSRHYWQVAERGQFEELPEALRTSPEKCRAWLDRFASAHDASEKLAELLDLTTAEARRTEVTGKGE